MAIIESFEKDCKNIASDIALIIMHSDKFNQILKRLTLDEWREFVSYYINEDLAGKILNDDIIRAKLDEMDRARPFSSIFKEGKDYFALIMPCDLAGHAWGLWEQKNGYYLTIIELPSAAEIAQNNRTINMSLLRDFMPLEIARDCVFTVDKYAASPDNDDDASIKARAAVLTKCARAILNLRKHFEGNSAEKP
jgi:hypothetical protein